MNKSCKYCKRINPGHTSEEHYQPYRDPDWPITQQFSDTISKITISTNSDEKIIKNILTWVSLNQPEVKAIN